MLITATVFLAGLSADVRRQSFLESYQYDNIPYHIEYFNDNSSLKNDFYLDDVQDSKRTNLIKELDKEISNNKVKINAVEIIRNLSALFVMNFDLSNFYKSSYGTLILEYQKDNSNFTIEIGEKSFGYFSEIDGEFSSINDEVFFNESGNDNVLGKLNLDFIDFYNY